MAMASSEYDALLEELKDLLKRKGELSLDDLKEWASQRHVGSLVLTLLVRDMIEDGYAKPLGEEVTLDKDLGLQIPSVIALAEKGREVEMHEGEGLLPLVSVARPSLRRTHKTSRKQHRKRRTASLSITSFFEEKRETKEDERTEPLRERREVQGEPRESRELSAEPLSHSIEVSATSLGELDEDLVRAIEYLSSYWSVGEVRFALDLKRMGIEDPERVIRRLLELGYIERTKLGVINATDKLPRMETKRYLSDLF